MSSFSKDPTIKKKVRFEKFVKIRFIPALESTRPIPRNYYKSNKNNYTNIDKQNSLLKPKALIYQPGIKKFMTMVFR